MNLEIIISDTMRSVFVHEVTTKRCIKLFSVCDYEETVQLAVEAACKFVESDKIYISGQITGLDIEEARAKFKAVDKALLKQGLAPINPFDLCTPEEQASFSWEQFMARDLFYLRKCKSIFMMLYWFKSTGAKLELATAIEEKLTIIHE